MYANVLDNSLLQPFMTTVKFENITDVDRVDCVLKV